MKFTEDKELNIKVVGLLLPFALELYHSGVKLLPEYHDLLVEYNMITAADRVKYSNYHIDTIRAQYSAKFQLVNEDAIKEELKFTTAGNTYSENDFDRQVYNRKLRSNITKSEWTVSQTKPDREFIEWINSINKGWQHKINNERYNLYKEQATAWIRENAEYPYEGSDEQQITWLSQERKRCVENSMYSVERYGIIPDTFDESGEMKFVCYDVQCFLLYMFDCGLSFMVGKPRQVGSTTCLALAAEMKTMLSKNFNTLLVAQKGTKSEEIFRDKVKFPINHFPHYMKPSVANWNDLQVVFQFKGTDKGSALPQVSMFTVAAPAPDVVNAGSPRVVLLDEIGLNDMLGEIILQGRPTIFRVNPTTGELEMRRQMIAWGTADTVSEVFEQEFKDALKAWEDGDYSYGMIPVFINAFAKPGFNIEHYEREKAAYYRRKKQPNKVDPKVLFHQTYPIYMEDMFITSDDTVIPKHTIIKHYEKVLESKEWRNCKRGYFEPVYDTTVPTPDSDVPFRIIGARFKPACEDDIEDDNVFACVHILKEPLAWMNRYFSGLDPIFSTSGHSKLSNTVWDTVNKEISAYINFKAEDYRFCYLQSFLMTLYYSQQKEGKAIGIKELVEINVGGEYVNYKKDKGYYRTLTTNNMLPDNLQTSTVEVGIRKMANSKFLVNKLEEICQMHSDSIKSLDFWIQLKTFVKKNTPTGEKFAPKNIKVDWDDHIDSVVYAYINAEAHKMHKPISIDDYARKIINKKPKMKYVVRNGQTVLVKVSEDGGVMESYKDKLNRSQAA